MPLRLGNELEGVIHVLYPLSVSRNLKLIGCTFFPFLSTVGLQIMPLYLHRSFVVVLSH